MSLGHGVDQLAEGDRVVWTGANGGYAQYSIAPSERTIKLPEELSESTACAALIQGLTALTLVKEAHEVEKADWIMVLAASGTKIPIFVPQRRTLLTLRRVQVVLVDGYVKYFAALVLGQLLLLELLVKCK